MYRIYKDLYSVRFLILISNFNATVSRDNIYFLLPIVDNERSLNVREVKREFEKRFMISLICIYFARIVNIL